MAAASSTTTHPIPASARWLAWVLLGALSVFFAGVVRGSAAVVFLNIYGLLVTAPLYFLHMMVLAPLVLRGARPRLGSLYLAGALFGLCEAAVTKVLWLPPDNPAAWNVAGVAVFPTLMLVLCWYPLMAFIIPLFSAAGLLKDPQAVAAFPERRQASMPGKVHKPGRQNPSKLARLPGSIFSRLKFTAPSNWAPRLASSPFGAAARRVGSAIAALKLSTVVSRLTAQKRPPAPRQSSLADQRRLTWTHNKPLRMLAGAGAVMGLIHGAAVGSPGTALLSSVSSMLIIFLLGYLWKRSSAGETWPLTDLLPDLKQWRVFVFLLAADYLAVGFVLRREAFPALAGTITILGLYLLLGGLLWLSRKADRKAQAPDPMHEFFPVSYPDRQQTPTTRFAVSTSTWPVFAASFMTLSAAASLLPDWIQTGMTWILWGAGVPAGLFMLGRTIQRIIQAQEIKFEFPKHRHHPARKP